MSARKSSLGRVKEYEGYLARSYEPSDEDLVCEYYLEPAKGISFESSPLGPLIVTFGPSIFASTSWGIKIGFFPTLDIDYIYQISQIISPPNPCFLASLSVKSPLDVEIIAIP